MKWIAISLAVGVAASASSFQIREDRGPNRQEFESMMEAYVLSKLQESLNLTDEQFGKMVVAQKKLQATRRQYRRERAEILREMRMTLQREQAGEEELGPTLRRLDERQRAFVEEERARYADIDAILDVRQRARYRILEAEIQRRFQELVRQVRQGPRERRY